MISNVDPRSTPLVEGGVWAVAITLIIAATLFFYFRWLRKKPESTLDDTSRLGTAQDQFDVTVDLLKQPEPVVRQPPEPVAPKSPTAGPVLLSDLLKNTRQGFFGRIQNLFAGGEQVISKDKLADLEEILYTSDLGPKTVERLMTAITAKANGHNQLTFDFLKAAIKEEMGSIFSKTTDSGVNANEVFKSSSSEKPMVWMIVGVNGVGKTTSIGKLAKMFAQENKKVLIAAGDTFRAAAQDQLAVWSERAQVDIHSPQGVTDPAAVAFEACEKAKAQQYDVVIIDTAGRLHNKSNLMEELKKMKRVVTKSLATAPHQVILVIDANSGQNALLQARNFHEALGVTGIILTKLDGTAKGGVAVGIAEELSIPILWVGVGEKVQDLKSFSPTEFVSSII